MRLRIFIAALLAGTMITPALAQDQQNRRAERMERRAESDGGFRNRDEGMRASPERAARQARPERQQVQPQDSVQPQAQPDRQMRQAEGGNAGGGWQRRQALDMNESQRPVEVNRRGRGDGEGGWRRRQAPEMNTPTTPPVVAQQSPTGNNRGWRGNNNGTNGGNWNRGGDRDNDGIRNGRDRDRDGDGIRNRRDWDRNNDGRVDRRWDNNNNGVVDRRFDRNRDGIRNNGGNWNQNGQYGGQRYGNNQGWNRQWRNDNRYNWERHRFSNRDLFRQPRYYSPYGYNYSYQRFGIGIYLDSVFFGSRYRISDPGQYRLPYAEWPYEWVRYYDDVLLVDTRNGYIVDVIHNFFW